MHVFLNNDTGIFIFLPREQYGSCLSASLQVPLNQAFQIKEEVTVWDIWAVSVGEGVGTSSCFLSRKYWDGLAKGPRGLALWKEQNVSSAWSLPKSVVEADVYCQAL